MCCILKKNQISSFIGFEKELLNLGKILNWIVLFKKKWIVLYCIRMLKILKKKEIKKIVLYCNVLYCIRMLKVWKKKKNKFKKFELYCIVLYCIRMLKVWKKNKWKKIEVEYNAQHNTNFWIVLCLVLILLYCVV